MAKEEGESENLIDGKANPQAPVAKPQGFRRFFRFSLRTLFVCVTFLSVLLGFIRMEMIGRPQREAVELFPGRVYYDWEFDSKEEYIHEASRPMALRLFGWIDADYFQSVVWAEMVTEPPDPTVFDLAPIAAFKDLRYFYWRGIELANLAPFASLTELRELHVFQTSITDLSPLSNMTKLRVLHVGGSRVADLSPLSGLTKLNDLWFNHSLVSDLSPIANLNEIEFLRCSRTLVSDLTPLANMINLKTLWLDDTRVTDLSPIRPLKNLHELDLSRTSVTELSPLENLKNLRILDLHGATVTNEEIRRLQSILPDCEIKR